jgi:hypothetical protein
MLHALIGEGLDHHVGAGHFSHRTLRWHSFWHPGNKKGTSKAPGIAHRHVSRVELSTPGGAPRYENQRRNKSKHRSVLSLQGAGYKHCGSLGQAKCGRIAARRVAADFKRTFEIGMTRQIIIVNQG